MPLMIFFKTPPMSLVVAGDLDDARLKEFRKALGKAILSTTVEPPNTRTLIPIDQNSNILYIKELTEEDYTKMKARRDEGKGMPDREGRIARPVMTIPKMRN